MTMLRSTRVHGVNSRNHRDWSWTFELLVMEMLVARRLEFFFAGGLRSALGRTSFSGPRTQSLILEGDPL